MNRPTIIVITALVVAVTGWYVFRPERLFVNSTVNEELPTAGSTATASPITLVEGSFHDGPHKTTDTASIHQLADGKRVLGLTNFEPSNAPDVHVYLLATQDATANDTVKRAAFVELGSLKGNVGDQNYDLPAD